MQRQIFEYHPVIGYRFVPNITARIPHEGGGYFIRTNKAGFRCDHEVTQEKPSKTFRILLFGDSFTAGDGVSNQFRYSDILEKHFEGLQILNFGLPGTGTDQQYLVFQEFAKNLEYDLLMICPLVENIRRVISRYRLTVSRESRTGYIAKPYFELIDGQLVLRHVPVPKGIFNNLSAEDLRYVDEGGPHPILRRLINTYLKPFKSAIQAATAYQPLPEYDDPENPAWILMKAILCQWISESGDRPVLICPIPLYHHIEQLASAENYQRRFQELASIERVTVHDPLPRFWEESPEGRRNCRFKNDPHFTVYGHQVLADALKPAIQRFLSDSVKVN
jgi:carbamoyltransferase